MRLEQLQHLIRPDLITGEVFHRCPDAHGKGLLIRIDHPDAIHPPGNGAQDLDSHPVAGLHGKTLVNHLLRQLDHLFDCQGYLVGFGLGPKPGFGGEGGVDPVCQQHYLRPHLPLGTVRDHADDLALLIPQQVRHYRAAHDQGACALGLLGKPPVKFCPAHGKGVVPALICENLIPVRKAVSPVLRKVPEARLDDITFDGAALLFIIGDHLGQVMTVKHAAGDILGPGVFTALEDDDLPLLFCQAIGSRNPRRASTHDGNVKGLFHFRFPVFPVSVPVPDSRFFNSATNAGTTRA